MSNEEKLKEFQDIVRDIKEADLPTISDEVSLQQLKSKYLGKKGIVTDMLKSMRDLPDEQKKEFGKTINCVKNSIETLINEKHNELKEKKKASSLAKDQIDVTLPDRGPALGAKHPISRVTDEIVYTFERMGFSVAEGPEVELDYYNFEALNIPKNHPARDMQDTFYISDDVVLRTHTSPVQIRVMERQPPPVKIIVPGKVYRCDSDISHTPMFHQIEGLFVDRGITLGNLKAVVTQFAHLTFGKDTNVRFRPSFFPFTEPSAEVDIECTMCKGKGCRVCKQTGWLEIMGCGMVDPEVFKAVGYEPKVYTGFAFGMGIERITMLKYGINDIRLFFENDLRFLRQFV